MQTNRERSDQARENKKVSPQNKTASFIYWNCLLLGYKFEKIPTQQWALHYVFKWHTTGRYGGKFEELRRSIRHSVTFYYYFNRRENLAPEFTVSSFSSPRKNTEVYVTRKWANHEKIHALRRTAQLIAGQSVVYLKRIRA